MAAIRDDPPDGRKEEDRNLAGKSHRAQLQSGTSQAVHKPRLRHGLHPGADQGNQLSAEEELEVAMPQSSPGCLPSRSAALARGCAARRRVLLDGILWISHESVWMTTCHLAPLLYRAHPVCRPE